VRPAPGFLSDPYHLPAAFRSPSRLDHRQWLVYAGDQATDFYDLLTRRDGSLYKAMVFDGARFVFDARADGWVGVDPAAAIDADAVPEQAGVEMLTMFLRGTRPIALSDQAGAHVLEQESPETLDSLAYEFFSRDLPSPWTADLPRGTILRRLRLDRASALPRELEIVHRDLRGGEQLLYRAVLRERRVLAAPADVTRLELPPQPDDTLRFTSTAHRWRRARTAFPPLSSHWLMSSFDLPGRALLVDAALDHDPAHRILGWGAASPLQRDWELAPALPLGQLSIGALQSSNWHDLSRLSALHRAQYRVTADGPPIVITQGPRKLVRHILRYPRPAPGGGAQTWTRSERHAISVQGRQRDGWLLYDDQFSAFVFEVPERDLMVHLVGPRDFLRTALPERLSQLIWNIPQS
jgi:hypothetical protein